MKMILLSIALCVFIHTARAQPLATGNTSATEKTDDFMYPDNSITGNILAFEHAGVFSRALNICDLKQTFNNPGPLTVFLPLDSAFNKLSESKRDSILRPADKYDLIALLTYHALPGTVRAKDIAKEINRQKGLAVFKTIAGALLKAQFDSSGAIVLIDETGGRSTLQKSNLPQQNGLIHLVSAPLIPKFRSI